ncbi:hypothetical protein [Actinophytocola sp.]|uniref:hypothetical protein n=1 Tax=Actinophytocola sp. TaxID=1872138 RepID=UPI003D6AD3DF
MVTSLEGLQAEDGEPVGTEHIAKALTAGEFVYDDGATQRFEPGGATTYVEHGRPTTGTWYLDDDGRFCSFWPPTYRACYDLRWIVADGTIVGLRFIEVDRGSRFDGRYR